MPDVPIDSLAVREDNGTFGGYAVALHIRARLCVVVGGGAVGERKARELQAAGAQVLVVAPQVTEALQAESDAGHVRVQARTFKALDLDGAFLVIVATDDAEVNQQVLAEASRRKILVNRAARVEGGDGNGGNFDTMATVRRGDLLIGVTTGGAGPAVSAQIRAEIAATWGPEWEPWVALLGQMRRRARKEVTDARVRAELLRRLAAREDLRQRLMQGGAAVLDKVREEAEQMLSDAIATGNLDAETPCPAR